MKRLVILLIILMPLWTGCINDIPTDCEESNPDATFMSFRSSQIILPSDATGVVESITIESVRILVFSKATGQVVTNELFDIDNLSLASQDPETGDWQIDFSNIVVETRPGLSIVYVVLNENIVKISNQTLTLALNTITNLTEMQALVNTPLSYTNPLKVTYNTEGKPDEPPFIMSTFDEFDILPGRPRESPYLADLRGSGSSLKGFELDRTMAKVTIDSISSYPIPEGPTTNNAETSYIFILKMGLVNVPMQYLWSPNRLQTTPPNPNPYTVPVPPYTGTYQEIDFGLEAPLLGYYDRDWNGSILLNIDADTYEVQEAKDTRIWYTGDGKGNNAYSIYKNKLDSNFIAGKQIADECYQSFYTDTNGDGFVDPTPLNLNAGNFATEVRKIYSNPNDSNFLPTYYVLIEPYNLNPQVNGSYWTLKEKKISYYVPEHILANKIETLNATKLHIRAAKASLPDTISREESTQIVWNETSWKPWIYSLGPGGINFESLNGTEFTNTMIGIHGSILDVITVPSGKNKGTHQIVRHYWSGLIRYREGHAKGTLQGKKFQDITSSTNIMDFYLPVRNTPASPVDYNIYRNHEYKFSVHALEQWNPAAAGVVSGTRNATTDPGGISMVLRMSNR